VDVSVEDSTLTVSGSRELSNEVKEESYHRLERRYGSFTRAITLPQTADTSKVEARFDKGVLTIEVPKVEKAKPKKIQVKAE
jgi:HSP20 family protein